jgi:hypothetical protein
MGLKDGFIGSTPKQVTDIIEKKTEKYIDIHYQKNIKKIMNNNESIIQPERISSCQEIDRFTCHLG